MIETFSVWDHDYLKISRWPQAWLIVWYGALYSIIVFYLNFEYFSIILRSLLLLVFTYLHKICLWKLIESCLRSWYFLIFHSDILYLSMSLFSSIVLALWNFLNLRRGQFSLFYFFGIIICIFTLTLGFPGGSAGKESACNVGDLGSIPGVGRSPGEGKGYPLQYSGLENSMNCIVSGIAKSWTRLSNFHFSLLCFTLRTGSLFSSILILYFLTLIFFFFMWIFQFFNILFYWVFFSFHIFSMFYGFY